MSESLRLWRLLRGSVEPTFLRSKVAGDKEAVKVFLGILGGAEVAHGTGDVALSGAHEGDGIQHQANQPSGCGVGDYDLLELGLDVAVYLNRRI